MVLRPDIVISLVLLAINVAIVKIYLGEVEMKLKLISIRTLALLSVNTLAADNVSGNISSIKAVANNAKILFDLNVDDPNKPGCNTTDRFVIDTSQPGGNNIYQSILHAQATDQMVRVVTFDTNPCADTGDAQSVKAVVVGISKQEKKEFLNKLSELKK